MIKEKIPKNKTGNNFWVSVGLVNAIFIYLANILFPADVVLGNDTVSNLIALLIVSVLLTTLLSLVKPLVKALKLQLKNDLVIKLVYGLTNIIGLWILARLAIFIGFGISSFVVAIALGVVLSLAQLLLWKTMVKK